MQPSAKQTKPIVFARLLIGVVVLICAEVFSGASLGSGLWSPWTLLMTYWLYFAHFFFFTTLACRTGRTSLSALYLWGVLFGLYESWITKVIWHGYGGDGKFAMGRIGPYGYSEISMVFLFHPVMSFILPLAVTCLLCPSLRRWFPELAWITGKTKGARVAQIYLMFSISPVMAMNSGGPLNLALNLAFAIGVLWLLFRVAQPALAAPDGIRIVAFGRGGFTGLCVYLALLYGVTYRQIRPEGLPSIPIQLLTFVFYAVALVGLWLHRRRAPCALVGSLPEARELWLVKVCFAVIIAASLALSFLGSHPALFPAVVVNFAIWTPLGLLLTGWSLARGVRGFIATRAF